MNKKLFCIFLSFVFAMTFINCAQHFKLKDPKIVVDKEKIEVALAQSQYCYGDIDEGLDPFCTDYQENCSKCMDYTYYTKCIFNCGTGLCNCDPNDFEYCANLVTLCTKCYNYYTECLCPAGTNLVVNEDQSRECVFEDCLPGTFRPNAGCTDCSPCDPACFTCHGPTDGDCDVCTLGYCPYEYKCVNPDTFQCPNGLAKLNHQDGCFSCETFCPLGMYMDAFGVCRDCNPGCVTCTDTTSQCPCQFGLCPYNNECVSQDFTCPTGYKLAHMFTMESCFDCVPCDLCWENQFCDDLTHTCNPVCPEPNFVWKHQCLPTCPIEMGEQLYYLKIDILYWTMSSNPHNCVPCSQCPEACDHETFKCVPCLPPNFMFHGQCMTNCPPGYFLVIVDGQLTCDTKCPDGHYPNPLTGLCDPCDAVCLTCSNGPSICDPPCPNGLMWHKSTCVPVCPNGYFAYGFYDMTQSICEPGEQCICGKCTDFCNECIGGLPDQCIFCDPPYYLTDDGRCVANCEAGYFAAPDGAHCYCCNDQCGSCYGERSDQCYSCQKDGYLQGTTCYTTGFHS